MSLWPNTLPAYPLLENFSEEVENTIIRTEMDNGPAKLRQRTTAGVSNMSLGYLLSKVQIDTLEIFYKTTLKGGSLAFDFTHPRRDTIISCRFVSPPQYGSGNGNFFRVNINLEVLP